MCVVCGVVCLMCLMCECGVRCSVFDVFDFLCGMWCSVCDVFDMCDVWCSV